MIALLYNLPQDLGGWLEWGVLHQADHLIIAQQIEQIFAPGQASVVYPLDPIPILNSGLLLGWGMNHQALHSQMAAATNTQAFDLTYINPQQQQQLTVWMQLHASEHQAVSQALANAQAASGTGG